MSTSSSARSHLMALAAARTLALVIAIPLLAVVASSGPAGAQSTPTADYRVEFDSIWSAATHPIDFPPDPHFSGLIGGTHNDQVTFWQTGSLASTGIKDMAEIGSKTALTSEVNTAIGAGTGGIVISGPGIGTSPGSAEVNFTAHEDFPLMTLVAMMAPSPDWFVGVSSLSLIEDGEWANLITVQIRVYDAGTDSGVTFTSPDQVTNPADPIALFNTGPFAAPMEVVGTYTIRRTNPPPEPVATPISPIAIFALGGAMAAGLAWHRRRSEVAGVR